MVSPLARRTWLLALLSALLLVACSKPQPPTITPQRLEMVSTNPSGLIVRVVCKAVNPNGFPLPTRRAAGTVTLGTSQLGTFEAASLPTLPAKTETNVSFDLVVPWANLGTVLAAAVGADELPYAVEGTADFEAAGVRVSAPFTMKSKVRKSDLAIPFLRFFMKPQLPKSPAP